MLLLDGVVVVDGAVVVAHCALSNNVPLRHHRNHYHLYGAAAGRAATVKQVSSHLVLQYEDFLHFLRTIRFGYTEHRLFSLDVRLPRGVVDDLVLDHLGRVTL